MTDHDELARSAGVLTSYVGANGQLVEVSRDTIVAVLECLGAATASDCRERAQAASRVEVRWDEAPYGYSWHGDTFVIRAPRRGAAIDHPRLGLFAPTYALVRRNRRDAGDLAGLRALFDWGADQGATAVLTLPLLAVFPESPSPYSPVSRTHWNELHLPLDGPADLGPRSEPPGERDLIDYPNAFARVHRWLDDRAGARAAPIDDYARFRAASDALGRDWRRWPANWRRLAPPALSARYRLGQALMRRELAALREHIDRRGGLLGLDLPLGVHPDGYDSWKYAAQFAWRARAGAPPDLFFPAGQNWGFAPPLPAEVAASGYAHFIEAVRAHLEFASVLRIDHVMQFRRLYFIPEGFSPTEGTYVTYPFEHYLAILCVESWRSGAPIVGENLGLVPAEVNADLERHGLLGTWVEQGALDGLHQRGTLDRIPVLSMASLGTHDMPSWAGFCAGSDIDVQVAQGVFSPAEAAARARNRQLDLAAAAALAGTEPEAAALHAQLLRRLSASDAQLVILNAEDLWLEPAPQNVPGTVDEHPNWRRPLARLIDDLEPVALVGELSAYGGRDGTFDEPA